MILEKFINRIFHLIGNDKIETAIQEMGALLKDIDLLDDLTFQKSRFHSIKKQIRNGLVDFEDANIELNRVRYALIDIARELEELSDQKEDVRAKLERVPEDFAKSIVQNKISNDVRQEGNNNNSINISGITSGNDTNINTRNK